MSDLWTHHPVTGIATLKLKFGIQERKITVGLFGGLAPAHVQAFRQQCVTASLKKTSFTNVNAPMKQGDAQLLKGTTFYKFNSEVGFWFGDVNNLKQTAIKDVPKTENFQYCLTSSGSDVDQIANVYLLVTSPAVDYLDGKHVVFGQLMDQESANAVEEIKKYVIVENCNRVSDNSEVLITDVAFVDQM